MIVWAWKRFDGLGIGSILMMNYLRLSSALYWISILSRKGRDAETYNGLYYE
jgi:hypothetical protein